MDGVVPGDDVSRYLLLHVTNAELIESATADWLRGYVRQGGTLVVEFPFACCDDNTWVSLRRPNNSLEDLLGCREAERRIVNSANPAKATFAFASGPSIDAVKWRVMFEMTGGTTVATWQDGRPAAVRHAYGRGTVISLGVNPSFAIHGHFTDDHSSIFMRCALSIRIAEPSSTGRSGSAAAPLTRSGGRYATASLASWSTTFTPIWLMRTCVAEKGEMDQGAAYSICIINRKSWQYAYLGL